MLAFALATFISAFLLFQVQPLITKFILPWFGGGPTVWSVSMLFFQTSLVAGYVYAHLLVRFLTLRRQAIVHILLLLLAITQIPVSPSAAFEPPAGADPTLTILWLLARTIGIPFFLLSATAPLIQAWVSRTKAVENPYRLYALSNVASMLALLTYPFLVEPLLTRQAQVVLWSIVFAVFLVVCGYCAYFSGFRSRVVEAADAVTERAAARPTIPTVLLWLALPAAAVALLLGVTNQVTQDLVSAPFLWVLPLSVYLLSFIICFDNERWYLRPLFLPAMASSIAALLYLLIGDGFAVIWEVFVYTLSLFILCMVCHGELNRLRPHPHYLTVFYLMIAIGGALGSALVAVGMPLLADSYIELQLGIGAVALLTCVALLSDINARFEPSMARPVQAAMLVGLALTITLLARSARKYEPGVIYQARNFYGVLTVGRDHPGTQDEALWLRNGSSYHGVQMVAPQLRSIPGAYYSPRSGVAAALNLPDKTNGRRVGMVGLGVGSVAAYLNEKDYLRVYEINPEVVYIAETRFTFMADTRARVDVIVDDARLSLEQEQSQAFDVFVLDAFSSDAIPVHLLTREAFETYVRHLTTDGVIAVLISSWHFDFEPLLRKMAAEFGMKAVLFNNSSGTLEDWGSRWVIMSKHDDFFQRSQLVIAQAAQSQEISDVQLWTDDYSSPFQLLK